MGYNWKKFMLESNKIERDTGFKNTGLNLWDEEAFDFAMNGINNEEDILIVHKILTRHLNVTWSGKYRKINVSVGGYIPPDWRAVPGKMKEYFNWYSAFDSWKAYNEFEFIHPFADFNGRTGRLIWLSKATWEGYSFQIPFLQMYHYQTLNNTRG